MRLACFLCFVLAAAACSRSAEPAFKGNGDVHVTIRQASDGPWSVTFDLKEPTDELDLGPTFDGHREKHWSAENPSVSIVVRNGRDFAIADKSFSTLSFLVDPVAANRRKSYEPFVPTGGGALFYTGQFIAFRDPGVRMQTSFTLLAEEGARIIAFDKNESRLDSWESPYRHPAFVYVGNGRFRKDSAVISVIDPAAPDWLSGELLAFAPAILEAYRTLFARSLPTKPNMFVAMADGAGAGRLAYHGDALPGQFQMTLGGDGWDRPSVEASAILRLSTAHEAAHLWQLAARPMSDAVPEWIHEGGADALAAEAMVSAGYWTPAQADENLRQAASRCASGLERRSLERAEAARRWEAVYACGHVLTVAAAGAGGAAAFWREFVGRAGRDGYDASLFLEIAGERAGADKVDLMLSLMRINNARPHQVIDQLLRPPAEGLAVSKGD